MRAVVSHPVPIRWTPPRSRRERLAFRRELAAVEIPERPDLARAERFDTGMVAGDRRVYRVLDGRFWLPVPGNHLERRELPGTGPAPLARALAFLAGGAEPEPGGLAFAGTPLNAIVALAGGTYHDRGADLPDAVPELVRVDHGPAARAALHRYAAERLATDGEHLYVRSCPPVLVPLASAGSCVDLPWFTGRVPVFPPGRLDEAVRYCSMIQGLGDRRVREAAGRMPEGLDPAFYGDDDLDHVLNRVPAILDHVADRYAKRIAMAGPGTRLPDEAVAALDRLRPLGDLARIGSVPPDLRTDLAEASVAAAAALRAICPRSQYDPEYLREVEAYLTHFALPRLAQVPDSEEDLDAIAGLVR